MRFEHLVGLPIRTEQQIDENVVGDANFFNLAVCCRYKPRRTNILRRGQNRQRALDTFAVVARCGHQYIDILRRAQKAVKFDRLPANKHVFQARAMQSGEQTP